MLTASQEHVGQFQNIVEGHYYKCTAHPLDVDDCAEFTYDALHAGDMRVDTMSGGGVLVERSWSDVRSNPSNIYLIRFPEDGCLSITQDKARNSTATKGQFVITYGNRPFKAKAFNPSGSRYKQLDIVVPSHILRSLLPAVDLVCGYAFSMEGGSAIARSAIEEMMNRSARIGPTLTARLADVCVEAITADVKIQMQDEAALRHFARSELEAVLKHIEHNFAIPGINGENVSRACRISRRHLYDLMSSMGTTFSDYLWTRRLTQAHDWLSSPDFTNFNISRIAHMCGFQSGSHFSKLYKERFGVSPKETRKRPC